MNVTKLAIAAIRGVPGLLQKIADSEGVTPRTVQRWIKDDQSELTKATVIRTIREETGLVDDQILEMQSLSN
jgi:hypothetical protein